MTTKTFIAKQEESVEEVAVQIRTGDPITPFEGQTWINTTQRRLKTYKSGNVLVLMSGTPEALEIPLSGICDLIESNTFFKTINNNYSLSFANLLSGLKATVRIENTSAPVNQITDLTFPTSASIDNGDYFEIFSANEETKYYVWFDLDGQNTADPAVPDATPVPVSFTKGLVEIAEVTCPAAASITSGQHFLINSAGDVAQYYFWFRVDGVGVDPAVPSRTGVVVDILSTDTNTQVASKLQIAADAIISFSATVLSNVVEISTNAFLATTDASNVNVGGLTILVTQQGVAADSAIQIAQKVRAQLDPLADFSAPVPVTSTLTVTNATDGFTADPINNGITGFSFSVTTPGEGRIRMTFPVDVVLDDNSSPLVPAQSTSLFSFLKIDADIFASSKDY
jgi:hypothetical protein